MNQQWFSFQEWVDVKVLEVNEGGRTLITSEHLRVIVDYGFYGIPESGVLFHMSSAPTRGRLDVTVWKSQEDNIFTLLDLNTDQVSCKMYISKTESDPKKTHYWTQTKSNCLIKYGQK